MSQYKVDLSEFGNCAGKCGPCRAGGNRFSSDGGGNWSLPPSVKVAINILLNLKENSSKPCELTIASPVTTLDTSTFDLGGAINERVEILGAPISPDTSAEEYLGSIEALKSKFQNLTTLMLGTTRELSSIDKQYLFLTDLLHRFFTDLVNGKSMAKEIFLIGGVNDLQLKDLLGIAEECVKFYSIIFPTKKFSAEEIDSMGDAEKTALKFLQFFMEYIQNSVIDDTILKDLTVEIDDGQLANDLFAIANGKTSVLYRGGGFRFGENMLRIEHSLRCTLAKGRGFTKEQIIDQLQRTDAHPVVHFSGKQVNVFHDVDSTKVPGVWVELEKYFGILQRARIIGYNAALIEHFQSI